MTVANGGVEGKEKIYDKFGYVLRIETFSHDATFFKHHRKVVHRDGSACFKMASVRKSSFSLPALAVLMDACSHRYISFLAAVDDPTNGIRTINKVSRPALQAGRSYRGFNLFDEEDEKVFHAVAQGAVQTFGFRNAMLRTRLGKTPAQISRICQRLRYHGLIKKAACSYKYHLTAFGFDAPRTVAVEIATDAFGKEVETLEETPEILIQRDIFGRKTKRIKKYATMSLPLDFPVKDFNTWQRTRPLFQYDPRRFSENWLDRARQTKSAGVSLMIPIPGAYNLPRVLMGDEGACLCYYTDPALMRDILDTLCDLVLTLLEETVAKVEIDIAMVGEDLAGNMGPMISPAIFKEFAVPYYRKIFGYLASHGASIFAMDTDGNINKLLPAILEAGFNYLYPFEANAGMDIVEVRKKYGKALAIGGGIDKKALLKDKAAIDGELEKKIPPLAQDGAFVVSLDHRVVDGTPLDNYRHYVKRTREILDRCSR